MGIINVKFDVYFKRELGTLFKSNEVDLDGLEANVNLDLDLVAFGNIADMMDMRNLETRYITLEGLKNVTNPFLKEIIDKNSFSIGVS